MMELERRNTKQDDLNQKHKAHEGSLRTRQEQADILHSIWDDLAEEARSHNRYPSIPEIAADIVETMNDPIIQEAYKFNVKKKQSTIEAYLRNKLKNS